MKNVFQMNLLKSLRPPQSCEWGGRSGERMILFL